MDSFTDEDIDRIFERIEKEVDIKKIKTKEELFKAINNAPKTRSWNKEINRTIFDIIESTNKKAIAKTKKQRRRKKQKRTQQVQQTQKPGARKQKPYKRSRPRKWNNEETRAAVKLRKDGLKYSIIAKLLARTTTSTRFKIERTLRKQQQASNK